MGTKETYWKRKNAGLCIVCSDGSKATHGVWCAYHHKNYWKWKRSLSAEKVEENRQKNLVASRKWNLDLKIEVLGHYGGICKCCKETDIRFLTIDHIHGGGGAQRKEIFKYKGAGSSAFYLWLKRNDYPEGYQVLCWNCNSGRHYNGGICPHKDHYQKEIIK